MMVLLSAQFSYSEIMDSMSDELFAILVGVGFLFIVIGSILFSPSGGGKRDRRFKTGYKGNSLPTAPSKMAEQLGLIIALLGISMFVFLYGGHIIEILTVIIQMI
jgi:hypothetical protein